MTRQGTTMKSTSQPRPGSIIRSALVQPGRTHLAPPEPGMRRERVREQSVPADDHGKSGAATYALRPECFAKTVRMRRTFGADDTDESQKNGRVNPGRSLGAGKPPERLGGENFRDGLGKAPSGRLRGRAAARTSGARPGVIAMFGNFSSMALSMASMPALLGDLYMMFSTTHLPLSALRT